MDRLVRRNVLAMSGRAVEAAGDVDVLLLDKTGTITLGNRQATEFVPVPGVDRGRARRRRAARLARRRDARGPHDRRAGQGSTASASATSTRSSATFVPFTAQTRMSGVDLDGRQHPQGRRRRHRALASRTQGGAVPPELQASSTGSRREGGTPLGGRRDEQVLGVVQLKDIVKEGHAGALRPAAARWASAR